VGDYAVIVAALAGAVAGLLLLRMASPRDAPADRDRTSPVAGPPTPTLYARRPLHTAAPILLAVGLALFGVGLAMGFGGAGDILLLGPGVVVLLAALAAALRGDAAAGKPPKPSGGPPHGEDQ
jgi:hypothetical protein